MAENTASQKNDNPDLADWDLDEVETLVHLYANEPILWDVSLVDYSKKDARHKALAKIQDRFENKFTVGQINYKLQRIRSYYGKEKKKVDGSKKSGAGTGEIFKSKWRYYDTLDAFLRPQIQPRKSSTNLDVSSQDETSQDESEGEDDTLSEETSSSGRQTPLNAKAVTKRRKLSGPAAVMAEAVSVLSSLRTRSSNSTPPQVSQATTDDEDLTFARYLAGELRKVKNPRVKHGLRMKLQNAIFEAQQEDEDATRQLSLEPTITSGGFLTAMQSDINTPFLPSSDVNYPRTYTNM